jgi:hypothetical protein
VVVILPRLFLPFASLLFSFHILSELCLLNRSLPVNLGFLVASYFLTNHCGKLYNACPLSFSL